MPMQYHVVPKNPLITIIPVSWRGFIFNAVDESSRSKQNCGIRHILAFTRDTEQERRSRRMMRLLCFVCLLFIHGVLGSMEGTFILGVVIIIRSGITLWAKVPLLPLPCIARRCCGWGRSGWQSLRQIKCIVDVSSNYAKRLIKKANCGRSCIKMQ